MKLHSNFFFSIHQIYPRCVIEFTGHHDHSSIDICEDDEMDLDLNQDNDLDLDPDEDML